MALFGYFPSSRKKRNQQPHHGRSGGGRPGVGQMPHYGNTIGIQGGSYNPQQPRPYSRGMRGGLGPFGQGNYNPPPPPPPPLSQINSGPNLGGGAYQQPIQFNPQIQHGTQQPRFPPPMLPPSNNSRRRNLPAHALMGNRFPTPGTGGGPMGGGGYGPGNAMGGGVGGPGGTGGGYGPGNAMGGGVGGPGGMGGGYGPENAMGGGVGGPGGMGGGYGPGNAMGGGVGSYPGYGATNASPFQHLFPEPKEKDPR